MKFPCMILEWEYVLQLGGRGAHKAVGRTFFQEISSDN